MSPRTLFTAAVTLATLALSPLGAVMAQTLATSANAQTFTSPGGAPVDLSAYTPTSGLPAVVQANAPVQPVDVATAAVNANAYTDSKTAALVTDTSINAIGARMATNGVTATPAQLNAVQASIPSVAGLITGAQVPNYSPVKTVNGLTGSVILPTYTRQVSSGTPVSTSTGYGTFTFSPSFVNLPTCFAEVQSTSTSVAFYAPQITSKDLTQVTMLVQAAPKVVQVNAVGANLNLVQPPPTGTTLNITCIAPN